MANIWYTIDILIKNKTMATENDSILDRVMETEIKAQTAQFSPQDIVNGMLDILSERDKNIVVMRHGLSSSGGKKTLEEIGKEYHITRERVRQIEVTSVKQIRKQVKDKEEYIQAVNVIEQILKEQGGVIEESDLIDKIRQLVTERLSENVIIFFLNLVKDKFITVKETKNIKAGWQLADFNENLLIEVLKVIQDLIEKQNKVLSFNDFWAKFKETEIYSKEQTALEKEVFLSFVKISRKLKSNPFGDWGMSSWNLISPKRMNDKIYLVLKHHGKPLHFKHIAERINEVEFDGKKAHPATVHNELILDHSRYVLVGRGIYALKEWGYKPGIVSDVIKDILRSADEPLNRRQVINEVLKKRIVKDTTIILALTNKDNFKKLSDGTYQIAVKD